MSLPARNDPARPLVLAVRSTRLLGIVSIGIGLFVVITGGYLAARLMYEGGSSI